MPQRRIRLCRCEVGLLSSLARVSGKSERRAARSVVADYHHAQLEELVARVGEAVDRYRAGELDAFDVDQVLFQYSRAAKELWKFCNSPGGGCSGDDPGPTITRLVGTRRSKEAAMTAGSAAPNAHASAAKRLVRSLPPVEHSAAVPRRAQSERGAVGRALTSKRAAHEGGTPARLTSGSCHTLGPGWCHEAAPGPDDQPAAL